MTVNLNKLIAVDCCCGIEKLQEDKLQDKQMFKEQGKQDISCTKEKETQNFKIKIN